MFDIKDYVLTGRTNCPSVTSMKEIGFIGEVVGNGLVRKNRKF